MGLKYAWGCTQLWPPGCDTPVPALSPLSKWVQQVTAPVTAPYGMTGALLLASLVTAALSS